MGHDLIPSRVLQGLRKYAAQQGRDFGILDYESLADRPWYFAYAPSGERWFSLLRQAAEQRFVMEKDIRRDIRAGWVRPSLFYQYRNKIENPFLLPADAVCLDERFVPPELRVPDERLRRLSLKNFKRRLLWFFLGSQGTLRPYVRRLKDSVLARLVLSRRVTFPAGFCFSYGRYRLGPKIPNGRVAYALTFVLPRKSSDRLQETICSRIADALGVKYCIHYTRYSGRLPASEIYCFPDHFHYLECLIKNPVLWGRRSAVFFSFSQPIVDFRKNMLIRALNHAARIIPTNSAGVDWLARQGIPSEKVVFLPGGMEHLTWENYGAELRKLLASSGEIP